MKKSRSSTPRLEARCPGLFGMAGAREDCEGDPRVEIAVGKTLDYFVSSESGQSPTMKGLNYQQTYATFRRNFPLENL